MVHFLAHLVLRMMTSPSIPLVGIFPHRLRGLTPMTPRLPVLSVVSMKRPEIDITPPERGGRIMVIGALGHCPLYTKLGHVPRSLRRPA